jgi:hypothetical protein
MIDAKNPAVWPGRYNPSVLPRICAVNAPATPKSDVRIKPPGSRPGIRSFAITPTMKPMMIAAMISINLLTHSISSLTSTLNRGATLLGCQNKT